MLKPAARILGALALAALTSRWATAQPPTFAADVAPILSARCAPCHHTGGDAPFSLVSYDEVRRRSAQIAEATRTRYMPPWKPDPGTGPFLGDRRLTDAEVARIGAWVAAGAPEGPQAARVAMPQFTSGWLLGEPDLVLTLPAFTLRADGPDVFRNFVVTVPGRGTRFVRGWQFRPGNRGVHHANIRIDPTLASRRMDQADPAPGYEGLILHSADYPDGHFLGWTPGQATPPGSPELAWRLDGGSDVVVQVHMQPTGHIEQVTPTIGLYFSPEAPSETPSIVRLGRQDLDIAPGAKDHTVRDAFVLPVEAQIVAIQPHAHYRAHDMQAWAELPDGSRRDLIGISAWDFNWQDYYRYASPFWLPSGTRLQMEYTFDNSDANPRNPTHPPERVAWGWRSSDEMADVWVQVMTRSNVDRQRLVAQARRKMVTEDAIGSEVLIARDPTHVPLRNDAALIYLELGQPDDALRHFQAVTRLEPGSSAAWYNEAVALEALKRPVDAAARYREAIRLDPSYSAAHNNLGSLLASEGRLDQAIAECREAVRLAPENAEAQNNLGGLLLATAPVEAALHLRIALGLRPDSFEARFSLARALTVTRQPREAVAQYRAALATRPDWTPALINLAWLLSAHSDSVIRQPIEAIALAERAVALTRRESAEALDVLAAAYAAEGRFDDAVSTGTAGFDLARSGQAEALAEGIRERVTLYRQRKPVVIPN